MWARWCEIATAAWLAASPWIFRVTWASPWPPYADELAVAVIVLGAIASHRRATRHAHLLSLLVGLWLVLIGWIHAGYPPSPANQNRVFTGLLLLMLALIPNHASQPPRDWRAAS